MDKIEVEECQQVAASLSITPADKMKKTASTSGASPNLSIHRTDKRTRSINQRPGNSSFVIRNFPTFPLRLSALA
jgi:hypothetical protein